MKNSIVTVHAIPLAGNLDPEDLSVPGEYKIKIQAEVPHEMIADVALDVFHSNIPVDNLDDFEFVVKDAEGNEMETNPEHDSYSGAHLGEIL